MRLKSTLWALAFACAAVSCSDDLENGPNVNNNNGEMGEADAYLKVVVNSDIATKAADPAEEAGSHKEYEVKDVTIILFNNGESSTNYDFGADSQIKGVGFAQVGQMEGSSTDNHSFMAQIEVPVSDPGSTLAGNTYGVIAVTNLGGSKDAPNELYKAIKDQTGDTKITKGSDLADYIIKYDQYNHKTNGFVMSTHAMQWPLETGDRSEVTFDENPTNENNAPTVNVYVERLAAKIRIKEDQDKGANFFYTITSQETPSNTIAKVALRQAAIVNQLNSGSYLLKRVSNTINGEGDITAGEQTYLGPEVWSMDNGTKVVTANYVIDPWFFKKNASADLPTATAQLSYSNPYRVGEQGTMNNIDAIWDSYSKKTSLPGEANDNGAIRLAYVMENTTKVGTSLQGYATGAVFKATYYPAQMSEVDETGSITPKPVTYGETAFKDIDNTTTGKTFYRYEGKIFKDDDAIFAYYLNEHGHFDADGEHANCNYTDFIGDKFSKLNIADFHEHFYTDEEAKHDPFGYLDYLHKESKKNPNATTFGEITGVNDFTAYMESKPDATTYNDVDEFINGECYYTYWIKHQDNKNSHLIAPMEYSIVRNNIYDLQISGVSGLGFARSMVPDPKDPTEDSNQLLNVVLHVKNWTVRPNSDIIL
ncbi:Mfa1 family fimbria major subunit [Parabacteroides distasonis]|uniref:Mfa1 family fimbria major subunit n=1 Tax=Parabacteroides distasonis TaxID=823 RepID=A0AAW6F4W5_PARDI|nr:Mfa1 family fimbria major subunit [Parabacteroides distasonis]MCS2607429.1 Mfa1 family fimbria major subunit [Parabacteroides distasonis]MDB9138379.1 Mfa1 family fimbria major subunit [Parabacteroides distasonis]MDB9141976.1 Mfa1 family fimbria major subunit [Parabacteroides distasonis]